MNRLRVLLPLVLLLTLHALYGQGDTGGAGADDSADDDWRVIDVTTLPDPGNSLAVGPEYLVSPDGTHLTWLNANWLDASNKICLMALPSSVRLCHAIPATYGSPSLLSWSPDSRYVLLLDGFGEFSFRFTFEPATREFLLVQSEEYTLVSEMAWNPTSDALSFLTYHYVNDTASTALRRFSLAGGTETIYELTPLFGVPVLFSGLVAVSDSRFVLLLRNNAPPELRPGLWLVNITTQTAEHLVSYNDLEISVRPEANRSFDDGDLVWDGERERLLVTIQSTAPQFKTMSVLSVDLETKEITPLLSAGYAGAEASGFHGGTLTPDGEFFFYFDAPEISPTSQKTIYALPLGALPESDAAAPIVVTDAHPIDCLATTALITLEHANGEQRRYVYEPHIFCPG